jgi:hypothetical protein
MDQDALVAEAKTLTRSLDQTLIKPKGVMLARASETGESKLWVVPSGNIDKREFYGLVAQAISVEHLTTLDIGMVELVDMARAERMGLKQLKRAPGISSIHMKSNWVNGVSMPDGVIIRMNL